MAKAKKSSMTVQQVMKKRANTSNHEMIPTDVDGFSLRVEKKGDHPDLPVETLGRLAIEGATVAETKAQIQPLEAIQEAAKSEIQDVAEVTPGFRGFKSVADNVTATVTPSHVMSWDVDRLAKILGPANGSVITEEVVIRVEMPLGFRTDQGRVTSRKIGAAVLGELRERGLSNQDLRSFVSIETFYWANEEIIQDMVANDQIKLPNNVATVEETWSISAGPLEK